MRSGEPPAGGKFRADRKLQGPMLGAQRRIEARIGQLLGEPKVGRTNPHRDEVSNDQTRADFRILARASAARWSGVQALVFRPHDRAEQGVGVKSRISQLQAVCCSGSTKKSAVRPRSLDRGSSLPGRLAYANRSASAFAATFSCR